MTLRACIYKNCVNYINLKDRSINKDIKLFSFPKNPERRQKWIELGKVPPNQPSSMYYFCSEHFDKKYFATNNVRTVLVGEAVPYPYMESEVDETYEGTDNNLDYYIYEMNRENDIAERQQLQEEQDLHVESTTMLNEHQEEFHDEHFSINLDEQDIDDCIIFKDGEKATQEMITTNCRKRKLYNTIFQTQTSLSNSKILKTSLQKSSRKSTENLNVKSLSQNAVAKTSSSLSQTQGSPLVSKATNKEEIDEDQLIDADHITTFIFKGEEYVQMPKEHYITEKTELMKKLENMENTVRVIKEHLNSLDF